MLPLMLVLVVDHVHMGRQTSNEPSLHICIGDARSSKTPISRSVSSDVAASVGVLKVLSLCPQMYPRTPSCILLPKKSTRRVGPWSKESEEKHSSCCVELRPEPEYTMDGSWQANLVLYIKSHHDDHRTRISSLVAMAAGVTVLEDGFEGSRPNW